MACFSVLSSQKQPHIVVVLTVLVMGALQQRY